MSAKMTLDEIKKCELNILKKFDAICKENNLEYSLAYGTMLGAVRHKGFIPWDDDIDVFMKRDDYEKLLKLQYEDESYEIKSYRYTKDYYYIFSKMIDKSTSIEESWRAEKNMGLYIDIFPLDSIQLDSEGEQLKQEIAHITDKINKRTNLCGLLGHKLSHHRSFSLRYISKLLLLILSKPFKKSFFKKTELYFANQKDGNYNCQIFTGGIAFYKSEYTNEIIYMDFEDFKAPVYKGYKEILTTDYGDYMTPPPPEQQVSNHWFEATRKQR